MVIDPVVQKASDQMKHLTAQMEGGSEEEYTGKGTFMVV